MPTLFQSGRVQVRMFVDHNPPHFHIVTPDGDMQIALSDFRTIRGRVRTRDYEVAMDWARRNIALLNVEWVRLNG